MSRPELEDFAMALGAVRPDGSLEIESWTEVLAAVRKLRDRVAVSEAIAQLETELTAILGQRPELISVRFERTKDHVMGSSQTIDLVRIEVWSQALRTTGRNLSVSTHALDSSVRDMLAWARKSMAR